MDTQISPVMGYLDNAERVYALAAQGWLVILWLLVFLLTADIVGYWRNGRDP